LFKGEVVKKFEENNEKRIQCDIIAQDALGSKNSRDFYCSPAYQGMNPKQASGY